MSNFYKKNTNNGTIRSKLHIEIFPYKEFQSGRSNARSDMPDFKSVLNEI